MVHQLDLHQSRINQQNQSWTSIEMHAIRFKIIQNKMQVNFQWLKLRKYFIFLNDFIYNLKC